MDPKSTTAPLRLDTPVICPGMDLTEELPADIDEPPDTSPQHVNFWIPPKPLTSTSYARAVPPAYMRRESLLTRQLHSETEHSDEDQQDIRSPTRGLSMVSTWSNPSTVSTAELTSDDGRSMPSPGISPFLPPTRMANALPVTDKPLAEQKILGLEAVTIKHPVEEGLGRKRCITFACGGNSTKEPKAPAAAVVEEKPSSPPKRKCTLKFACPSKPVEEQHKSATSIAAAPKRAMSPPPKHRRSSSSQKVAKVHRGSDSTVTNPASPRVARKAVIDSPKPDVSNPKIAPVLDNSDDSGAEATRFHEFGTSDEEPDEWTQESTCYRNRLCVTDTLKKENVIRQLGQEVEEEVLAEEEDEVDEEDQDDDVEEEQDDIDEDDVVEEEDDDESDDGFHSDDEHGFAADSDSDGEGSDNEWWTPGRPSTAATSAEHLEHHTKISSQPQPTDYPSSLASMSSANVSPHSSHRRPRPIRTHSTTAAMNIERPTTPDLPDSTDFVCGTLDEDRPKEQAYINLMKEREAAKHRPVPQDIDPTFPTSDPEMDEEDDEDIEDPAESSAEEIMHGSLDSIHGTARRISPTPRRPSTRQRSPGRHKSPAPTAIRHKSPAPPAIRHKSPAPSAIRHKSPAPPTIRHRSPAPVRTKSPAPKVKPGRRSPPPPTARAHSPAPRKLFGQSPHRAPSPASSAAITSPPSRISPSDLFPAPASCLAGSSNTITVTASLPKHPIGFMLSRLGHSASDVEGGETPTNGHHNGRRRGAIDIVKGLEKKKQRRREKLCQKLAAKAAARGEERKKVKPGRGAERMREVGLELQKYKGRAGHILSY